MRPKTTSPPELWVSRVGPVAQTLSAQDQLAQLEAHLAVSRVLASTGLPQPRPLLVSRMGSVEAEEGNTVQAVPGL